MNTLKRQLQIERKVENKELGFWVSFDPGNDAGDGMFFPYDAFQYLLSVGKRFLDSCMCTEAIQRWEKNPTDR